MADITITEVDPDTFEVVVQEGSSSTTHQVTLGPEDRNMIPTGRTPADLVEASFRFLLDREPKESILTRFELSVISRYFPEYREEIGSYL